MAYSVHLDGVFHNTQRVYFFIPIASAFALWCPTLRKWTPIATVSHINCDFSRKKQYLFEYECFYDGIELRVPLFAICQWQVVCYLTHPFDRIICYCQWKDKPCDGPNCSTVKQLLHHSNLSRFQMLKRMLATTSTKYV